MVRISIDTEKDSPEMIAKLIEVLNAHVANTSSSYNSRSQTSSYSLPSSAPVQSSSNPFAMFGEPSTAPSSLSSDMLPSSAPVTSSSSGGIFDVFGSEDRPNQQKTSSNSPAGYADNDLFGAFSNSLPSTDFTSSSSSISPAIESVYNSLDGPSSFSSASALLDDDFNPIKDDEDDDEPEEKSSNFFSFEQY